MTQGERMLMPQLTSWPYLQSLCTLNCYDPLKNHYKGWECFKGGNLDLGKAQMGREFKSRGEGECFWSKFRENSPCIIQHTKVPK